MARKKSKPIIAGIKLERYAAEGKSVGTMEDGKTIFITGGVPGDIADVVVTKNKSSFAEGRVLKIVEPSKDRIIPFCQHFGICGGCKWQMLAYAKQLEYKQQQVLDQLTRIGKIHLPEMEPILGCERDRFYRNKLEFTFSALNFMTPEEMKQEPRPEPKPVLGFHATGRFDKVVDIQKCWLMDEPTNKIKNLLRDWALSKNLPFYNSRTKEGWLRNLIIRVSREKETLVNLIVTEDRPELKEGLDLLLKEVPEITSLHYTFNNKMNDTIYDLPVNTYWGKGYIEETLEKYRFKISPKSFFQTNSYQAEKLYGVVREFAALQGTEVLYDLYCGTGSIGIFLSDQVKSIIGVETVPDAIRDAKENAAINHLNNCSFFVGDVSDVATDNFFEQHGKPDVVITDPPRPGMSEDLVRQLIRLRVPKIIYVSCNPATQARDLNLLDEVYRVDRIRPVDMFPQTHHIENVALLTLK